MIDGGLGDELTEDDLSGRGARFLLYWTTITKKTTITSYTASSFLASVTCTPSGFPFKVCG